LDALPAREFHSLLAGCRGASSRVRRSSTRHRVATARQSCARRRQELHPPPSGDGDTERTVGNDLVPDRLLVLAPEIA
jgi:hypothetical protein